MSKYPNEAPCKCRLRVFPHRRDQYCRELAIDEYVQERNEDERNDERNRARYVNALNRNAAK